MAGKKVIQFCGDSKWIDYQELVDLYDDDVDHMCYMFEIFLRNIPVEFEKMHKSFKTGNAESLAEQAHKIKPTFSMVGIKSKITNNFFKIEQKAKKKELDQQMYELISTLDKYFKQCLDEVRKELEYLRKE